jgi:hypothetical protein
MLRLSVIAAAEATLAGNVDQTQAVTSELRATGSDSQSWGDVTPFPNERLILCAYLDQDGVAALLVRHLPDRARASENV